MQACGYEVRRGDLNSSRRPGPQVTLEKPTLLSGEKRLMMSRSSKRLPGVDHQSEIETQQAGLRVVKVLVFDGRDEG
jgi:hypothetical protein